MTVSLDQEIPGRALPVIDADNAPYFEACAHGELWMQRCVDTGRFQFYPRPCSIHTGGEVEWVRCSGLGTVHTFTVIRTNYPEPYFQPLLPYVVAMIEIAEGARMMSNLTGCQPQEVCIGMPVEAHFACIHERTKLFVPFWRPRQS